MRVCILGTSHVGRLAFTFYERGLDAHLPWDFFAVPALFADGKGLYALEADPKRRAIMGLPSDVAGDAQSLCVDSYEAFFLVGGQPSSLVHARMLRPKFSRRFQDAALEDMYHSARIVHAYQLIRSLCDTPIYVASDYLRMPNGTPPPPRAAEAEDRLEAFWQKQGATFLRQPPELLQEDGTTRPELFISETDFHLKQDAATIVLEQIKRTLGA